jgi:glycosyltransferase involved in cell wall biosynthesis
MKTVLYLANAASIHTVRWVNAIAETGNYHVHLLSLEPPTDQLHAEVSLRIAPVQSPAGYFLNSKWGRRVVQDVRPRFVHAHYASGYGTLARLVGFHPTVLSVWGADIYEFPRKSALHRWLMRKNLDFADRLLSTSRVMAEEVGRYTQKPIAVTPFGVDIHRFRPKTVASPFSTNDIVIGTVKTLDDKYGIDVLIRAFKIVRDANPHQPLKLLIVGGGPRERYLKILANQLGVMGSTVFTGAVPHGDVPDYFNMLTVAVFPSTRDSESFGVSVIEAGACGRPVVVSRVGGLPEVVQDQVTGLVVERCNPFETAAAIEKLVLNPAMRMKMGEAGLLHVRKHYGWAQNVQQLLEIYDEMTEQRV